MAERFTWLVLGASGLLGHTLCSHLAASGEHAVGVAHSHDVGVPGVVELQLDLTDEDAIDACIGRWQPDVIVNASGLTNVDACEADPLAAHRLHVDASAGVARAVQAAGSRLVHISTDHLWDGSRANVTEDTPPAPLNVYARTKWEGERVVLEEAPGALVVRTNFFGHGRAWRPSFSDLILSSARRGEIFRAFTDVHFTPIEMTLLSAAIVDLVGVQAAGVMHVAGSERISKFDFARRLLGAAGFDEAMVEGRSVATAGLAAPRPLDMSLGTDKAAAVLGRALPDVAASLRALLTTEKQSDGPQEAHNDELPGAVRR